MSFVVLLNLTTFPGGFVEMDVNGCHYLKLLDNYTYFLENGKREIYACNGTYTILVKPICAEGNKTLIVDNKTKINFTVLKPSYDYLLNITASLTKENTVLKQENLKLITQIDNMNKTIEKYELKVKEYELKVQEFNNIIYNLKFENSKLKNENKNLKLKIKNLTTQVENLKSQILELEKVINTLNRYVFKLKILAEILGGILLGVVIAVTIRR
jgi:cell division protein FtsB